MSRFPIKPHEFSVYAPIRLREEYYWQIGLHFLQDQWVLPDGKMRAGMPQYLDERYISRYVEVDYRRYQEGLSDATCFAMSVSRSMSMRSWCPLVAQYEGNGRQIFDFHDRLTEMLVQTDLGECTLANLKLPYDAFFLYFGRQAHIAAPWPDLETGNQFECLDGLFIAQTPWEEDDGTFQGRVRWKIGLSTVKDNGNGVFWPGPFLDIRPDEAQLPVLQAVQKAVERTEADLLYELKPGTTSHFVATSRVELAKESADLITKAAPLIFNALFYLESLGKPPEESPGRDTSSALTQKWLSSKPDRRFKVKQEMRAKAYTVVRLVGAEFANHPNLEGAVGSGSKRPHWRRGFWREHQPYGPREMQLRRRAWVRPAIVGVDRETYKPGSNDLPGHIYVPGSDRPQ